MNKYKLTNVSSVKLTDKTTGETIFESDNFPTEDIKISGGEDIGNARLHELIHNRKDKNMDTIFVIYLDGVMYTENNRKCAYLHIGGAKSVITNECKNIVENMFEKENGCRPYWYELGTDIKQKWLDKARERFEIREFVERVK